MVLRLYNHVTCVDFITTMNLKVVDQYMKNVGTLYWIRNLNVTLWIFVNSNIDVHISNVVSMMFNKPNSLYQLLRGRHLVTLLSEREVSQK
jgi:hypothetical protein